MKITLNIHEIIEDEVIEALRNRAHTLETEAAALVAQPNVSDSWKKAVTDASQARAAKLRELADAIENGDDF
jgi:hypothetical protein